MEWYKSQAMMHDDHVAMSRGSLQAHFVQTIAAGVVGFFSKRVPAITHGSNHHGHEHGREDMSAESIAFVSLRPPLHQRLAHFGASPVGCVGNRGGGGGRGREREKGGGGGVSILVRITYSENPGIASRISNGSPWYLKARVASEDDISKHRNPSREAHCTVRVDRPCQEVPEKTSTE